MFDLEGGAGTGCVCCDDDTEQVDADLPLALVSEMEIGMSVAVESVLFVEEEVLSSPPMTC